MQLVAKLAPPEPLTTTRPHQQAVEFAPSANTQMRAVQQRHATFAQRAASLPTQVLPIAETALLEPTTLRWHCRETRVSSVCSERTAPLLPQRTPAPAVRAPLAATLQAQEQPSAQTALLEHTARRWRCLQARASTALPACTAQLLQQRTPVPALRAALATSPR